MNKHIFKPSALFTDDIFQFQHIPDPFDSERRSKTTPHENRLINVENSQKLLKNEDIES